MTKKLNDMFNLEEQEAPTKNPVFNKFLKARQELEEEARLESELVGNGLTTIEAKEVIEDRKEDAEKASDFNLARENMKTLLDKGEDALEGILDLATSGEHPRAYEVAGQIIKTLAEVNKDLLNLHKQKAEVIPQQKTAPTNVTNQTVFVGSTKELSDFRKKMREQMKKEDAGESAEQK